MRNLLGQGDCVFKKGGGLFERRSQVSPKASKHGLQTVVEGVPKEWNRRRLQVTETIAPRKKFLASRGGGGDQDGDRYIDR